ncbi:MAG TPA: aromatic ring-hydroxylating dioxygenase subunit alpha, partial [Terriglobales bacterium]|nr:aromatic ring-hydroxylating dioxygenase subunit alpha [Terriglobales bacterium]
MGEHVGDLVTRYENFLDALPETTRKVLPEFWQDGPMPDEPMDVPIDHIVSRACHELEKERLWSKVWQFACREENIPNVGDQYVYDICDKSYLIVRSAPDEIKAFVNSCLHRGRQLREYPGNAKKIRCAFHAFTWNLDGSIAMIPCVNEFGGRSRKDWQLPEVKVGTWGGFVFINPDPNAEPLETYLGVLPKHFARWRLEDRYISAHVSKIVPTNWKIAQEAFMESFHVTTTHPQAAAALNDWRAKNDAFGNISRAMGQMGSPSPLMASVELTNQDVVDAMVDRLPDDPQLLNVPPGMSARTFMAEARRESLRPSLGEEADKFEETELVDIFYYTVFPNFHPWGAFNELVYRFRPNGDDHRTAIMEV